MPSLESLAFDSIVENHLEIGGLNFPKMNSISLKNRLWIENKRVVKLTGVVGIRQARFIGYTNALKQVFLDSLTSVGKASEKVKASVLRLLCEDKELAKIESLDKSLSLLEYLTLRGYFESFSEHVSLTELRNICQSNDNTLALEQINSLIERYEVYMPFGG